MSIAMPIYAEELSDLTGFEAARALAQSFPRPRRGLMKRLFRRRTPTLFQSCLAVHMHFAERSGALHSDVALGALGNWRA